MSKEQIPNPVGMLATQLFGLARAKQQQLNETWVLLSARVGSRLPASLLMTSIQREGELDLVIRCLEDEQAHRMVTGTQSGIFDAHYLNMLSTYWVGGMYEIFRLLKQRNRAGVSPVFDQIFHDLEPLRITLEKHEIAKDKKLGGPLAMTRNPPNHDSTDAYTYDPKDDARAHIMPMGVSPRGSMSWHVVDVRNNAARWIERRDISDRIIELWKSEI